MTGSAIVADLLARGHTVIPWHDAPEIERGTHGLPAPASSTEVRVGGAVHRVPYDSAVRFRGDAALIYQSGRVRVLVAAGEVVLDDAEELALRTLWSEL